MNRAERVAFAITERFDEIDAVAMAAHPAFQKALADALDVLDEAGVVAEVVAGGTLAHARNPHAVIVFRLRRLPELVANRDRLTGEVAEERRWAEVDAAVRRGETLRALVDRGALFPDEAQETLRRELADEELRAIALAALGLGRIGGHSPAHGLSSLMRPRRRKNSNSPFSTRRAVS